MSPTDLQKADGDTREGCERKWWFRRVGQLPEKSAAPKALEWGDEGHAQVADYLRGGARPTRSDVVRGMHALPEPGPDLVVEEWVDLEIEGVRCAQKLDLAHGRGVAPGTDQLAPDPPGTVEVRDWKFPSSDRYVLGAEQLLEDLQLCLYAEKMFERGAPIVRMTQVQFIKSPAKVLAPSVLVTRQDIAPAVERARRLTRRLKVVAGFQEPDQATPNPAACGAFGGCDYADECSVPQFDPLAKIFGREKTMGILSNMRDRAGGKADKVDAAKLAAEERRDALSPKLRDAVAYLQGCKAGYPQLSGRAAQVWAAATMVVLDPGRGLAGTGELGGAAIEDPEDLITVADELRAEEQAGGGPDADAAREAQAKRHPSSASPPDAPAADPEPHLAEAEAKAAKGKARKKAAAAEEERAASDVTGAVSEDELRQAAKGKSRKASAEKPRGEPLPEQSYRGLRLFEEAIASVDGVLVFVDCASNEWTMRLEPWVRTVASDTAVAAGFKADVDVRLCSGEALGFNRWRAAVERASTLQPLDPGIYALDTRGSELAEAAVQGLLLRADVVVVRGFR